MFCPNCGTQLPGGVNFCPNCGTRVSDLATSASAAQGNMVMLVALDECPRATAVALLQQLCGYTADEAALIVDSAPITVARGLTDAQARYLAQAFAEYGMEVSVYDGDGWRDWESESTSVWDATGALIAGVASALGLMSLGNRIPRDMMRRGDYPFAYSGARPPVYRLNRALRATPRRVAPVRPPVHRAPPPPPRPIPTPRPASAPPRPAPGMRPAPPPRPAPPRSAPAPSARPAPPRPAPGMRPAPAPGPAPSARPAPGGNRPGGPMNRPGPGGGTPGGRPGGGAGRRG